MANDPRRTAAVTPQDRLSFFPFPEVLEEDLFLADALRRERRLNLDDFPAEEVTMAEEAPQPFNGDMVASLAGLFCRYPDLLLEVYERASGRDGAHDGDVAVYTALPDAVKRSLAADAKCRRHALHVLRAKRIRRHVREHGRVRLEKGPSYWSCLLQHAKDCPVMQEIVNLLTDATLLVTH